MFPDVAFPIMFEGEDDPMTRETCGGVQIENWVGGQDMVDWFAFAKPPVAKSIDDEPERIRQCREVSPDTFWIGRPYSDDQDMSNPLRAATKKYDSIMRKAMLRDVDAWEGWNEVTGGHGWNSETLQYIEAEDYLVDFLHREDVKYVAGSWSVGCPSDLGVWWWHYMLNLMRKVDYLGLHEYLAPIMWDIRGFDPPYIDKEEYLTSGWFTLRYRKVREILEQHIPSPPPIIITETGIDSGAARGHWDPGAIGGWKSFTNIAHYMEQLAWWDRQLLMDDYIVGWTVFTFGTRSQQHWGTYDMWEPPDAKQALGQYLHDRQGDSNGGNGDEWEQWVVNVKRSADEIQLLAKKQPCST